MAIEGFDDPPPWGTEVVTGLTVVLVVAGAAVLLLAGAAVLLVVADGAVVLLTGATVLVVTPVPPDVPWAPVVLAPAGGEAGAASSAEAGRAPRSRKSPARSAKDAAHLRGLTTSISGLVHICWGLTALAVAAARRA